MKDLIHISVPFSPIKIIIMLCLRKYTEVNYYIAVQDTVKGPKCRI